MTHHIITTALLALSIPTSPVRHSVSQVQRQFPQVFNQPPLPMKARVKSIPLHGPFFTNGTPILSAEALLRVEHLDDLRHQSCWRDAWFGSDIEHSLTRLHAYTLVADLERGNKRWKFVMMGFVMLSRTIAGQVPS